MGAEAILPELIETHCHLDFPDFNADRDAVIARACDAGVRTMISIGTTPQSSQAAVDLADQHDGVYATVGIHPCHVCDASSWDLDALRELARHPRVAAIGEIGLDYHRLPSTQPDLALASISDEEYKIRQAELFRAQLEIAREFGLNVVIHQRDAWDDTLAILRAHAQGVRCVFHCFGGSPAQAEEVFALGHFVSFTGIVTFKNAKALHETVRAVPLDRFMVETDCPYLAPTPHRGQRCEPWHTRLVAEEIAKLRGVPLEQIALATTANARSFFRLND